MKDIGRRGFASGALAVLGSCGVHSPVQPFELDTVKERVPKSRLLIAAEGAGISFGCSTVRGALIANPEYRLAIRRYCNIITPEQDFKWDGILWERGNPKLDGCLTSLSFAKSADLKIRGHALLWHGGIPGWARALQRVEFFNEYNAFLDILLGTFGDEVDEWVVCNEIVDAAQPDKLRRSQFAEAGFATFADAFKRARAASPQARLIINDYGLGYERKGAAHNKIDALFKVIDAIQREGAKIDAIGLQSHLDLSAPAIDSELARLVDLARERNLEVILTELDVNDSHSTGSLEERDVAVMLAVQSYLEPLLSARGINGITTWAITDLYSFLNESSKYSRKDCQGTRGGVLDWKLREKAVTQRIASLLGKFAK